MEQRHNSNRTRNIVIGVISGFFMLLLLIGCIVVTVKICQYADEGKIDKWLEEDTEESDWHDDEWDDDDSWGDDDSWDDEYDDSWDDDYDDTWDDDYDDSWDEPIIEYEDLLEGPSTGKYFSYESDNRVDYLNYQVEMVSDEYFDEGTNGDEYYTTYVQYFYPVISGDVPNVDIMNDAIRAEWESFIEFYEMDYKPYISGNDDSIYAELIGRVAYMSEDVLSVVYQESISYGDSYQDYYVYCLNFDMKSGMLLDNTEILKIDEAFVEMFKEKSEEQNGSFSDLEYMTDAEASEAMNSSQLILFYVPQGMEVGLNTENGWVSITLDDYKKYMKSL